LLPLPFDSMFNLLQCCCELSLQLHRMCLPCHVLLLWKSTGQGSSRESLKAIVSLSLPAIRCIRHVTVVKKFVATSLEPIEECSKCVTQAVWHINVKCVAVTSSQLLTPWRISRDRFLACWCTSNKFVPLPADFSIFRTLIYQYWVVIQLTNWLSINFQQVDRFFLQLSAHCLYYIRARKKQNVTPSVPY
jgi:hypothetical protein